MNKWIDVNEQLPFRYAPVLIWFGAGYYHGCSIGYCQESTRTWYSVFDLEVFNVVAWQPLPFGPNNEALVSSDLIKAKAL